MDAATAAGVLTPRDFERFSSLVHASCGINMGEMKYELLRARLAKRMRALGLQDFKAYYELVTRDESGRELAEMIDVVTTNKTEFFRESGHYAHLAKQLQAERVVGRGPAGEPLRFWSAACSSGEEPYTLAMVLHETLAGRAPFKILGTDISGRMIQKAMAGVYSAERVQGLPLGYREKYFEPQPCQGGMNYAVLPHLRAAVQFSRFNLLDPAGYGFSNKFDAIFCRNVMIYFDRPTQEALVERLSRQLAPGGLLYTGFSESLIGIRHGLKQAGPSAYVKPGSWEPA
jgi:chemotaxis protein methyltransferase CheR